MNNADESVLLAAGAELRPLGGGAIWAEGPVWIPGRSAVRFSDIPNNRILEWSEDTGQVSVYAADAQFTNGRTLGHDGAVIQCSHGRRRVEVDRDGEVTALVSRWGDRRLNSPNDVVVKSDGNVWFSDPSYGIERPTEGHPGEIEYGDHYVFRYDPAADILVPVVLDAEMPNGLAFSPDESILYVADTGRELPSKEPNPGGAHCIHAYDIHAYDVQEDRLCKNGRIFAVVEPGLTGRTARRRARKRVDLGGGRRPRLRRLRGAGGFRPGAGDRRQPVLRRPAGHDVVHRGDIDPVQHRDGRA